MKAIMLVGGMGTRLRPITYEIPKPLLPVKKKPIINHLLDLLGRHGINEIGILASRSHQEDFEKWYKSWLEELSDKKINIFYEEKPNGTFGGMHLVKDWLGKEDFVLTHGDELKEFDLNKLIKFHKANKPVATIALVKVPNPKEYGVPVMEGDYVKEFLEKPKRPSSDYVNAGLSIMNPKIFDYADFSKENHMYEKDIYPRLARDKKLMGLKMEDKSRWYDCGTLERWERAIKEW